MGNHSRSFNARSLCMSSRSAPALCRVSLAGSAAEQTLCCCSHALAAIYLGGCHVCPALPRSAATRPWAAPFLSQPLCLRLPSLGPGQVFSDVYELVLLIDQREQYGRTQAGARTLGRTGAPAAGASQQPCSAVRCVFLLSVLMPGKHTCCGWDNAGGIARACVSLTAAATCW